MLASILTVDEQSSYYNVYVGIVELLLRRYNCKVASTLCCAAECDTLQLCYVAKVARQFVRVHMKKEFFAKVTKTVERDQWTPSDFFLKLADVILKPFTHLLLFTFSCNSGKTKTNIEQKLLTKLITRAFYWVNFRRHQQQPPHFLIILFSILDKVFGFVKQANSNTKIPDSKC